SFIEITDAATATLAAVGSGAPGIYNVVDDDPAPVAEWLPHLAQVAGTKPPLRLPAWLGRLLAGAVVVAQIASSRRASNQKARKELGWVPRYASWRRDSVPGSAAETGAAACRPLPQGVPLARDRRGATLALLSFAMLIVSLDQYIVVVALPSIGRALGYS